MMEFFFDKVFQLTFAFLFFFLTCGFLKTSEVCVSTAETLISVASNI